MAFELEVKERYGWEGVRGSKTGVLLEYHSGMLLVIDL